MDYRKALELGGKGYVILGAGQGIGLATADAISQLGGSVLCIDRDEKLAISAAEKTRGHHIVADVTKEDQVAAIFERAGDLYGDSFGGLIDVVGVGDIRPVVEFSEQEWDSQFDIVLRHAFFAIKHSSRVFPNAGGTAVFVGSIGGIRNMPGTGVYGVAKAALHHLVSAAAIELAPRNIRINAIAPGPTMTPRVEAVIPEEIIDSWRAHLPLGRLVTTEDVAALALFLSSDLARNVTGAIYLVDSGVTNVGSLPKLEVGTALIEASNKQLTS